MVGNWEVNVRFAVNHTAGDLCSAMPSIANVRAEINELLMKAEGKSSPAVSRVVELIRNKGAGCIQ